MRKKAIAGMGLILLVLTGERLAADVTGSAAHGFCVETEIAVQASAETVYRAAVEDIARWWLPDHTFTGSAGNLYLEPWPKGWFAERLPRGGFVRHMQVVYLAPGETIRLQGGLGPLQESGIDGALTLKFLPADEAMESAGSGDAGDHCRLQLKYAVSGYLPTGLGQLAQAVDQVLTQQLKSLQSYAESRSQ